MEEEKKIKRHNLICMITIIAVILAIVIYVLCDDTFKVLLNRSKENQRIKKETQNIIDRHDNNLKAINEKYGL